MKRKSLFVLETFVLLLTAVLLVVLLAEPLFADELELLTGSKGVGTILSESNDAFEFEFVKAGKTVQISIQKSKVHAATQNGKRRVINEKPTADKPVTRTPKQITDIIEQQGSTPPDWLASTPLNFPKTLDLSFADPPQGAQWNNQKVISQYAWDIINPNQGRWKQGVKLMMHLLEVNKANPHATRKTQKTLGDFYFNFFQDYPRAAYWWTKSGVAKKPGEYPHLSVLLSECYWKLGSREMAIEMLGRVPTTLRHIKLFADMGDLATALNIADQVAKSNNRPDTVYIYAGDACRTAGQFDKAISYYKKVLAVPEAPNRSKDNMLRNTKRAAANIIGINAFNKLDISKIADGVYKGDSAGFAGQLYVAVTVKDKKIVSVKVTQHEEKQYYSSIDAIPRQIVERQSLKDFDAVSGATATSEAIINAAAKALVAAQKN